MAKPSTERRAEAYVTPRWVKILGAIALVLAVLAVIAMVTGLGGTHGPGRHLSPEAIEPSSQ